MSATIDANPTGVVPANQPLVLTFSTDTTVTDAFRFVVQVLEDTVEIGKYYLAPNSADVAHFDVSEIVRQRVEVDDQNHTGTTVIHAAPNVYARSTNAIHSIQVRVGEWNGTTETLNQDNTTFYVVGGTEQKSSGYLPDFSTHYATGPTRKGWLTDYVAGTYIEMKARHDDEGRMAFIAKNTWSEATAVNYSVTTAGGVLSYYVPILSTYGGLAPSTTLLEGYLQYAALLPATLNGLATLDGPEGSATTVDLTGWISYTVQLVDGVTAKSKAIRVTRDCVSKNYTQIAWANSRGGWDYLNFNGKRNDTTTVDSKPYKKTLGNWDGAAYTFKSYDAEVRFFHKSGEQVYQLNTICTEEEMAVIRSLMLSRKAMIRLDKWLPAVVDESSFSVREAGLRMYQVSFSVKLAQAIVC